MTSSSSCAWSANCCRLDFSFSDRNWAAVPLSLLGKISTRSGRGKMAYHKSSFLRSFSDMSPAGVAKSTSSTAMRERRLLILFLTATVSWKQFVRKDCEEAVVNTLHIECKQQK